MTQGKSIYTGPQRKLKQITPDPGSSIKSRLSELLVGQPEAIETICPYVQMHEAGLSPEGRPIGNIILLGPTGSGKTHTVESLAYILHGNRKKMVKINCGEFQMEHEVAKLIGAPPGYLGHRETQPMLSQIKINAASSDDSDISLILFDEIEKAAPSLERLLLGLMDKGVLQLGDNSTVNLQRCIIFLTSNLGAKSIQRIANPDFGFEAMLGGEQVDSGRLKSAGMAAVKRKFSPEFVNRIDSVITYKSLNREAYCLILDQIIDCLNQTVASRLGMRGFRFQLTEDGWNAIIDAGTSIEYGARELKRTMQRVFVKPVAALYSQKQIPPTSTVVLDHQDGQFGILIAK